MVAGRMNAFSRSCRDAVMDDLLRARRGGTVLLYRRADVLVKRPVGAGDAREFCSLAARGDDRFLSQAAPRRRVASQAIAFELVSASPRGWMGDRRLMAKS